MSVLIKGMQLPEKCCKCDVFRRDLSWCPVAKKHIFDAAAKPEWCPQVAVSVADVEMLKKMWADEPEVLDSIEKAVIA